MKENLWQLIGALQNITSHLISFVTHHEQKIDTKSRSHH